MKKELLAEKKRAPKPKAKAAATKKTAKAPARIAKIPAHEHETRRDSHVPGVLVVRCKQDVVRSVPDVQRASLASLSAMSLPEAVESPFRALQESGVIREIRPIFSQATGGRALSVAPMHAAAAFAMSVRDVEEDDLRGITLLRVARDANLGKIEKTLRSTRGIEYVHTVPRRWMTARPRPNDRLLSRQWGLETVGWFEPNPLPNARTVKVAVLDSGVDKTHPDLAGRVKYNHDGASSQDIVGHGTHVAGIIAARINNSVGISGVCRCDLNVWKVFTDTPDPEDGEYYVDEVMWQRALNDVRKTGMRVLNLSIGGGDPSETEKMLFHRLYQAGVTVVAAMGNEYHKGNPIEYPAAYQNIVSVGAIGRTKRRASFSNTGRHIDLVAPGMSILSTLPLRASAIRHVDETRYAEWDGTSMATPFVTAAAALILARNPSFTPDDVRDRLITTTTRLGGMGARRHTKEYGFGLLNIDGAVA